MSFHNLLSLPHLFTRQIVNIKPLIDYSHSHCDICWIFSHLAKNKIKLWTKHQHNKSEKRGKKRGRKNMLRNQQLVWLSRTNNRKTSQDPICIILTCNNSKESYCNFNRHPSVMITCWLKRKQSTHKMHWQHHGRSFEKSWPRDDNWDYLWKERKQCMKFFLWANQGNMKIWADKAHVHVRD
jgi:hypothetical protein